VEEEEGRFVVDILQQEAPMELAQPGEDTVVVPLPAAVGIDLSGDRTLAGQHMDHSPL